ncbi:MAG: nickel-dependent lactate racemase [Planctomycetota bacterium]
MKIKLAYGEEGLDINLPDYLNFNILEPRHIKGLPDQAAAIEDALLNPIGSKPLREIVNKSDTVGIVINDITRPMPYKIILPILLRELGGIPDEQILLFNATGTHRPNTDDELAEMLGKYILNRYQIIQNDAGNRSSHRPVGTTKSGNEIRLHNAYLDCDVRILTGFIEPHFFAGFSGGGKAVMPGLALLETIIKNHSVSNIDHPKATWGVTYGNPIWEEIQQAAKFIPPHFLLNLALNKDKKITAVFAGDFHKAYKQGCDYVRENVMVSVEKPYDIVITSNSGYPLDMNLYQAVKGMSVASRLVRSGGGIVVAAECRNGIPDHGEYGRLLFEAKSCDSLLRKIHERNFVRQDMWQAQIHSIICQKADVYFHSRNLSDEQIKRAFLKPCSRIEDTVEELLHKYGKNASICILPEGPQTIPCISQGNLA